MYSALNFVGLPVLGGGVARMVIDIASDDDAGNGEGRNRTAYRPP